MAKVISSVAGTRTEPVDSYIFVRGNTAIFKKTFLVDGRQVTMDVGAPPTIKIYKPMFLNQSGSPSPEVVATIEGALTPGQEFEYRFEWEVPAGLTPLDNYVVSYFGTYSAVQYNFGDEYFTVSAQAGQIGTKNDAYCTVADLRLMKHNIDSYVPEALKKDLVSRNDYLESHIRFATTKLSEELSLFKSRGYSANYRLFCIFYSIWSILLSARGEDGSSVSDQNLVFWRNEWESILKQEKREGVLQGIPLGRG